MVLSTEDIVARVKEITRGEGVAVVYDSVGKDTFMSSLDCLRPLGMMVSFGNASGPPPAFSPLELAKRGSLFLTRPTLFHYIAKRDALESAARELFAAVKSKAVRIKIGQTYALGAMRHRRTVIWRRAERRDRRCCCLENQAAARPQRSIARPSRRKARSRPISATVASMGGETVPPVIATRSGCATLPRPRPFSVASAVSAS